MNNIYNLTMEGFNEQVEKWSNRRPSERTAAMVSLWSDAVAKLTAMGEEKFEALMMDRYQKRQDVSDEAIAEVLTGRDPQAVAMSF